MEPLSSNATRLSLLHRVQGGGGERDWEEFLAFYDPFISRLLGRLGYCGPEMEDLKQDICLRLWKGIGTYRIDDPTAKFRTWLNRVVRNSAAGHLRHVKRRPKLVGLNTEHVPPAAVPSDLEKSVDEEWKRHVVQTALSHLEEVFSGHAIEVCRLTLLGYDAAHIAGVLDLQPNTVYVLRHRVKRRLAQEVRVIRSSLEDSR